MQLRFAGALWRRAIALPIIVLAIALTASVGPVSRADTPTARPSPAHTTPRETLPRWCRPDEQRILQLQIAAWKRLQKLARGEGETLCATLEAADQLDVDTLLDPRSLERRLTQHQRELLQSLGVDLAKVKIAKILRLLGIEPPRLDLRGLQQQCRQSQGGIDRFATDELRKLEQDSLRCDERV